MTNYMGVCLSVIDMEVSKRFYTELMEQPIEMDLGANVSFRGFALQAGFAEMLRIPPDTVVRGANDAELYFEVADLDAFQARLDRWGGIDYVHPIIEQPWAQKALRFYDPDRHIVEVGEELRTTALRLLGQGLTAEETAARMMLPLPLIEQFQAKA